MAIENRSLITDIPWLLSKMNDSRRTEINEYVFVKYAKPKILSLSNPVLSKIYKDVFLPAFKKGNYPVEPISEKTFYVYEKRLIDPDERVRAQQGRVALRHQTNTKLSRTIAQAFCSRIEVDCFHEPIAILDHRTFQPIGLRPIHYVAIEDRTNVVAGLISDYHYGRELSHFVVELYKNILFPKPDFKSLYGTKHENIFYCKPFMIYHDGGSAYIAQVSYDYIALSNTVSGLAKTQYGKGKGSIESFFSELKSGFTFTLEGHYNDNQKDYIDTSNVWKEAVLTDLEHQVLLNRHINDKHNYGFHQKKKAIRADLWALESSFRTPAIPDNPNDLLHFSAIKGAKTIQPNVGIQYHVNGMTYTYNSLELQKLRRVLMQRKKDTKIQYHRSTFSPQEIKVINPIEDSLLAVPLIENPKIITPLAGEELFAEFAKTQSLESLSKLSDDEIIQQAKKRKRLLTKHKKEKKKAVAKAAKSIKEVAKEDKALVEALIAESHSTQVEEETSQQTPSEQENSEGSPENKPTDHDSKSKLNRENWKKPNITGDSNE